MQTVTRRWSAAARMGMGVGVMLACWDMVAAMGEEAKPETLAQIGARVGAETKAAYEASPFAALAKDYFARFSRDPEARPTPDETVIDDHWTISTLPNAKPLTVKMAGHLREFLTEGLGLTIPVKTAPTPESAAQTILLLDQGGGKDGVAESFTLSVNERQIVVRGRDAGGLRDGVVKLVEQLGFRQAPFLKRGEQTYTPRLAVRLGAKTNLGTLRDVVFTGYNAVFVNGGGLYELSVSDAIPELKARRVPGSLKVLADSGAEARSYGMKTYCFLNIRQKFPKDDPIFKAHPEIRGALTWKADGEYVLCTEHPLVKQWMTESVEGIFKADPELTGLVLIIGGEGFYHCFMRPFGVEKGHTNCPRCEAIGADKVVSNLLNTLAEAVRKINPKAEVIGWPYSAEHVWSLDRAQSGTIKLMKPGTGIFTEMEKDEIVEKPEGVKKALWDYSIDLIGPGERAKQQIAACRTAGISIYMKSEPEDTFEASRLPELPCLDRWVDRAEAMASCGANGAWVFSAFRPVHGTSPMETYKCAWWAPTEDKEKFLQQLATRVAGPAAGPRLRNAWKLVSEAIPFSPEIPAYYTGPIYLGPAQPMCVDPEAKLPEVFYGRYLFMAEMTDDEGLKLRPTFNTSPTGNAPVFEKYYRNMEALLAKAAQEIDAAAPQVPARCRLPFSSEASSIRWFYHTSRTAANFYESCRLREQLRALAAKPSRSPEETAAGQKAYARWNEVLRDEKTNATEALPIMEADVRLDFYYGGDHTFPHGADMIRAKLTLLDTELKETLPALAKRCGLDAGPKP